MKVSCTKNKNFEKFSVKVDDFAAFEVGAGTSRST